MTTASSSTSAASSFWESLDLTYPEGFGRHHVPPRVLVLGSVLAGKRSLVHALKTAHDQRANNSAVATSSAGGSGMPAPSSGGTRRQQQAALFPGDRPEDLSTSTSQLRPHGLGLEQTTIDRDGGKTVEVLICDKPELIRLGVDEAHVSNTVVIFVLDGSEPAGISREVGMWVRALNAAVLNTVGKQRGQVMLSNRQEHWLRQCTQYDEGQDDETSLRRVVAQRYRDAIGHGKEPGEAGHPFEDAEAVSLLPSILALTKLDNLEKLCRAPVEANQRLLLNQLPLLHFVLQTTRRLALATRSAVVALNSKAPTEANTVLYLALLRYVVHLQRVASEALSASSGVDPSGGGDIAAADDGGKIGGGLPTFPDGLVAFSGNHLFAPIGFDEYRLLHNVVFSPDVASISDFLPDSSSSVPQSPLEAGGSPGGRQHNLHDLILRQVQEEAKAAEKCVWEQ